MRCWHVFAQKIPARNNALPRRLGDAVDGLMRAQLFADFPRRFAAGAERRESAADEKT
jgi:hypothetical protein